ncbi:MAG: acetolactate synthase small subunit [Candidatus Hodarchaeaceae archaeon]|nr:acetolactate synthase small subunit [Candidatus Hodarchaeaceae archaeon]
MKVRIFSVLCENAPGVMMRISRVFTRRQINIDSITVGIEPSGLARIILLFQADDHIAEFMRKLIARLTQVIDIQVIDQATSIVREIALLKTKCLGDDDMWNVMHQVEKAGGRILESKNNTLVAEVSGTHEDIEKVIEALGQDILREVVRSGQVIISREMS